MMNSETNERLAAVETKLDLLCDLMQEHRSHHFYFSLMALGTVATSLCAVVIAFVT